MEKKAYYLTIEDFEQIKYFKSMFELAVQDIEHLCKIEKTDIEFGFKLGLIYSQLRGYLLDMLDLESNIKEQIY